jgi:crotonobetainyl-CoA:carnitine CoA-transferase CaiB-like acyl-CoA transferase
MTPTASTDTADGARGPFAGLRVLDLSWQIAGPYCTKLLADYGADVIKVERPGSGDPARHTPPFFHDQPDPEGSLLFLYLNTNKRGVTLNLAHATGRRLFLDLARTADVVVESFRPGVLDRLGIGWEVLSALNPRLILTSISNFGQTGPDRDLPASELVEYAVSGMMTISGRQDREPLKHGLSQGQYSAGVNAAYITAALTYTQALGAPGQWIDVSIQESLASELVMNEPNYAWMGAIQGRRPPSGDGLNNIMPCKDGHVVLQMGGATKWSEIADLLGVPELHEERFATPQGRTRNAQELDRLIAVGLAARTKHELFDEASKRRILIGIAQDPADLLNCPQLAARGYWVEVDHPTTGPLPYAGEPVKMSATPWQQRRPAPLLGQHTDEVLGGELGLSAAELAELRAGAVI